MFFISELSKMVAKAGVTSLGVKKHRLNGVAFLITAGETQRLGMFSDCQLASTHPSIPVFLYLCYHI